MSLIRDQATPGRASGTKAAALAQGGVAGLAIPALLVLNRHLGWGLTSEEVITIGVCAIGLLQAASAWYQRRATERVERRLKTGPRG